MPNTPLFGVVYTPTNIFVASEYLCITYQLGWAGWQVYITEPSEGSTCYQMLLISLRDIVTCGCVAWAMSAEVCVK